MSKNTNKKLHRAKQAKNDEFYTDAQDVYNELIKYHTYLKGAHILAPCDYNIAALSGEQKDELAKTGRVGGINDGFAFSTILNANKEL